MSSSYNPHASSSRSPYSNSSSTSKSPRKSKPQSSSDESESDSDSSTDLTPDGCKRVSLRPPPFPGSTMVWDDQTSRWTLQTDNSKEISKGSNSHKKGSKASLDRTRSSKAKNATDNKDNKGKRCSCQPCGDRLKYRYCPLHGWGYNGTQSTNNNKKQGELKESCGGNSKPPAKSNRWKAQGQEDNDEEDEDNQKTSTKSKSTDNAPSSEDDDP